MYTAHLSYKMISLLFLCWWIFLIHATQKHVFRDLSGIAQNGIVWQTVCLWPRSLIPPRLSVCILFPELRCPGQNPQVIYQQSARATLLFFRGHSPLFSILLQPLWTSPPTSVPSATGTSWFFHAPSLWCCCQLGLPRRSQLPNPASSQPPLCQVRCPAASY